MIADLFLAIVALCVAMCLYGGVTETTKAFKHHKKPPPIANPQTIRRLELEIYGHTWGEDAVDERGRPWPPVLPHALPANTRVTGTKAGIQEWAYDERSGEPYSIYADREGP
jgi:hypothetical protein